MRSENRSRSTTSTRGGSGRRRHAFTLIELLVVVAIIAILISILVPAVNHVRRQAKVTRVQAQIQTIDVAVNAFSTDQGSFPASDPWADSRIDPNLTPTGAHALALALVGDTLGNTPLAAKAYMPVDKANAVNDFNGFADVDYPEFPGRSNDPNYWGYLFKDVSFGGPILYYRANRRAKYVADPSLAQYRLVGDGQNDPLAAYNIADNALITGATADLGPNPAPVGQGQWGWPSPSPMFTLGDDARTAFADLVEVEDSRVGAPDGDPLTARAQNADSFILLSPGPDGMFGFDASGKCDDIGNFKVPTLARPPA